MADCRVERDVDKIEVEIEVKVRSWSEIGLPNPDFRVRQGKSVTERRKVASEVGFSVTLYYVAHSSYCSLYHLLLSRTGRVHR